MPPSSSMTNLLSSTSVRESNGQARHRVDSGTWALCGSTIVSTQCRPRLTPGGLLYSRESRLQAGGEYDGSAGHLLCGYFKSVGYRLKKFSRADAGLCKIRRRRLAASSTLRRNDSGEANGRSARGRR